jgi:hypothetical protein
MGTIAGQCDDFGTLPAGGSNRQAIPAAAVTSTLLEKEVTA